MDAQQIDRLLNTLLYEGYALYPYRPALKNTHRWTFGTLFPKSICEMLQTGDPWRMQAEFLAHSPIAADLSVEIRFLQPVFNSPETIEAPSRSTRESAVERRLAVSVCTISQLLHEPIRQSFQLAIDGDFTSLLVQVELSATQIAGDCYRLTASIGNITPVTNVAHTRESAQPYCLASTHLVFRINPGQFISLIDPPVEWAAASASCQSENCWPVLLGGQKTASVMLASPIILYDNPQIAAASHGDLFDATEIDEMLSLRILTLTSDEKQQMASFDERTRRLLQRTESLAGLDMQQMHSASCQLRPMPFADKHESISPQSQHKIDSIQIAGQLVRIGDLVRLRPKRRADICDLALQGQVAQVAAIEQDFEDRVHLAVCVVADPGADIGLAGKIGHRIFFQPDEVDPLAECET